MANKIKTEANNCPSSHIVQTYTRMHRVEQYVLKVQTGPVKPQRKCG